jgi:hypothetical protein
MKVIGAHDYLPLPSPKQDFKELRRIMAGFIVAVAICAGICAATIRRDARRMREHSAARPATHLPCRCLGQCGRLRADRFSPTGK